jgi:hypothetical protein
MLRVERAGKEWIVVKGGTTISVHLARDEAERAVERLFRARQGTRPYAERPLALAAGGRAAKRG